MMLRLSRARAAAALALLSLGACHHRAPPHVTLNALTATPKTIDSMWTNGQALFARHKWSQAALVFSRLELELPPADRRVLQARLLLGEAYVRSGSNLQGVREYQRLVDEFPTDSLAPEALLKSGDAYLGLWRGPELDPTYGYTAQSVYSEVLTRYPNSPAAAKANAQIARIDNWFAIKDYGAGSFYMKYKAYESAALVYKGLLRDHPKADIAPKALLDLISVYRRLGYADDLHDMCALMQRDYGSRPEAKTTLCTLPMPVVTAPPLVSPTPATRKPVGG